LHPLDPEVVLSQLRSDRPSTSSSGSSGSTVYSIENIRQVQTLVRRITGPYLSRDQTKLSNLFERMATENSLLKAQVTGLKQAVSIEQKRRKRGKGIIQNVRTITDGKAMFWSPQRIQSARTLLDEQERLKEQEAFKKAEAKLQKQLQKEENQRQVH
jgi:hypothetical protein